MKLLTLLLILTLPLVAQDEPLPPPDRLEAPDDSAAVTDEEIDAAWASFRCPSNKKDIQPLLDKWARHCEAGNGGLRFAEPARYTDDSDPVRPVAAWSHPQTFGADYIVLVRGPNKIEIAEQLCLPVFTGGRKDAKVMRAFFYADRQLEDVQLVNKRKLDNLIANGRLTQAPAEGPP